MPLTAGVEETYYKSFVLTEEGLKEFHKLMENAAQRFPAPAEVVYTIVTSDFRHFETHRIEEVLYDLDVQKKHIIQLIITADFIEQPHRIEGDVIQKGTRENWYVRVNFNIVQKEFWDTYYDKISIRVVSEDRKWANDYINRLEELIYKTPRGHRSADIIFWLFGIPATILSATYIGHLISPKPWLMEPFTRLFYILYTLATMAVVLVGAGRSMLNYNPYGLRIFFGPESSFSWGYGKAVYEDREQMRQYAFWVVGVSFILILLVSIQFALR